MMTGLLMVSLRKCCRSDFSRHGSWPSRPMTLFSPMAATSTIFIIPSRCGGLIGFIGLRRRFRQSEAQHDGPGIQRDGNENGQVRRGDQIDTPARVRHESNRSCDAKQIARRISDKWVDRKGAATGLASDEVAIGEAERKLQSSQIDDHQFGAKK